MRGTVTREQAVAAIADNYRRTIDLYAAAARPA
jgi:hypothetical protein